MMNYRFVGRHGSFDEHQFSSGRAPRSICGGKLLVKLPSFVSKKYNLLDDFFFCFPAQCRATGGRSRLVLLGLTHAYLLASLFNAASGRLFFYSLDHHILCSTNRVSGKKQHLELIAALTTSKRCQTNYWRTTGFDNLTLAHSRDVWKQPMGS